jgi:hypothetical protein
MRHNPVRALSGAMLASLPWLPDLGWAQASMPQAGLTTDSSVKVGLALIIAFLVGLIVLYHVVFTRSAGATPAAASAERSQAAQAADPAVPERRAP